MRSAPQRGFWAAIRALGPTRTRALPLLLATATLAPAAATVAETPTSRGSVA